MIKFRTVEEFIDHWEEPKICELLQLSHDHLLSLLPELAVSIKWNVPFFHYIKPLCYLNVQDSIVKIGFWNGAKLIEDHPILSGNTKRIKHLCIYSVEDLFNDEAAALIFDAAEMNKIND